MAKKKRVNHQPLTDADWRRVFQIRCRGKKGEYVCQEDHEFAMRAFKENEHRYSDMNYAVFEATKPFGA